MVKDLLVIIIENNITWSFNLVPVLGLNMFLTVQTVAQYTFQSLESSSLSEALTQPSI